MTRLVLTRLAGAVGLLVLLYVLIHVGVDLLPGDPVTARLGPTASPERIAEVRDRLGLDRPVLVRYGEWVGGLLHGDLGVSATGRPVSAMLGDRLANSALLAGLTLVLLVPVSLAAGLWAGLRRDRPADRIVSLVSLLLVAVPEFVVAGALVLVVAVGLRWFSPVSLVPAGSSPLAVPEVLVLPVLSLLLLSSAYAVRVIRATTAAAARAPHVEFARLNGTPAPAVLRHAILPAVLPVALQVWLVVGVALVGGAVLVEIVYGYPGVGSVLVESVQTGDLPVVQAVAMVLGAATLLALLAADLGMRALIPTLRTGAR